MEMLGYGPNEFPHQFKNITKLIDHNDLENALHTDIRPCLEGEKDDYEVEYRMRHKDGKWLWILSRGVTVKNDTGKVVRVAGTHSDITERKRMEEALSAERERLQGILDNSPVGIAFSTKRIIRFANPMFRKMFGIDIGDSVLDMYVAPEERDKLIEKLKAEGKVENYELQLYGRGGDIRDILITYLPIQYEGEDGVLGWLLDISDRKRVELEIREKYDELARFRRLAVGREKKMIELKREINELLKSSGLPKKYKIH
jgi:PAS domain S-box-containing protein